MDLLTSLVLGLLLVKEVQSLALNLTVDKGTGQSSEDLLGLGVAIRLAYYKEEILAFLSLDLSLCTEWSEEVRGGGLCMYRSERRGSRRPWLPRSWRHRQSARGPQRGRAPSGRCRCCRPEPARSRLGRCVLVEGWYQGRVKGILTTEPAHFELNC